MSFLNDIRNLFPWPWDFRKHYNTPHTIPRDTTRSSTGWIFYEYLPFAASWMDEQPQEWILKKGEGKLFGMSLIGNLLGSKIS